MERVGFANDGLLRLPPGFRFHPTDEELVVQYLMRKVQSRPLPASIIPEVDVCGSDPWDLPGESDRERYFFSTRRTKYPNGSRSNRATGSGYWKATGSDKRVASSRSQQETVGMKKTLVFYRGKAPKGSRTDWIMHEYRLHPQESDKEDWVLCRVFMKKRSNNHKNGEEEEGQKTEHRGLVFYDFMAARSDRFIDDSSSGSSGVTEISDKDDYEESSGGCK